MKLGKVKLLPFFLPGDVAMGEAVRGLAGKRSAVMFANHGPVVAGKDIEAACNAIEELEDTARLAMITRGMSPRGISEGNVQRLITKFDVEWDGLCCTNPMRDSSRESSMVAGMHEQTYTPNLQDQKLAGL